LDLDRPKKGRRNKKTGIRPRCLDLIYANWPWCN
jgi:hypothetical protein